MASPEELLDRIESRDDFLRFLDALGADCLISNGSRRADVAILAVREHGERLGEHARRRLP